MIEHVADDRRLLAELERLLHPHGTLVVTVPALPLLYGQRDKALGHFRRYNKPQLYERLNEHGFHIDKLDYWNILGVGPYFVAERLLKRQLSDNIRQGRPTPWRKLVGNGLYRWLLLEQQLRLPFGLTLIALARKPARGL